MQGTDGQLVAKFLTCQKFLVPSGLGSTTAGSLRCVCGFVPRVADGWHNSLRGYPRAVRLDILLMFEVCLYKFFRCHHSYSFFSFSFSAAYLRQVYSGVPDANQAKGCLRWGERRQASPLWRKAPSDATALPNAFWPLSSWSYRSLVEGLSYYINIICNYC